MTRNSGRRQLVLLSPKALSAMASVGKTKELLSLPCSLSSFPFHFDARCELPQKRLGSDAMEVVETAPRPGLSLFLSDRLQIPHVPVVTVKTEVPSFTTAAANKQATLAN